ncbi:hypothetical protein L210DRAFT_3762215, partial [Boletus edulis BED1]
MFARLTPLLVSLVVMTGIVAANDLGSRDVVQECIAPKNDVCCKYVVPSGNFGGGLDGTDCTLNYFQLFGCGPDTTELCCKRFNENSNPTSASRC